MNPSPLRPILSVTALLGVCLGMLCLSESVGKVALVLKGPETVFGASTNSDGDTLTVTTTDAITITDATDWTVTASDGATPELTYSSGSGSSTIVFSCSPRIGGGATYTLTYGGGGATAGLAAFSDSAITNNSIRPTLPETFDTAYSLPVGGTTITVGSDPGDDYDTTELQTAINAASPGDVIVLRAGDTFTGNFLLPNKGADSDWIYIISSQLANLPEGTRVTSADTANMAKLTHSNYQHATLGAAFGANHYRIAGIEIETTAAAKLTLVQTGYEDNTTTTRTSSLSELPKHIVFDRMYLHAADASDLRHGIMFNGQYLAVLDCTIDNIKEAGNGDTNAIYSYDGTGPYKIVNNFLEGAGENVIFGGNDPTISNVVSSDIEFRGNHVFKRVAWKDVEVVKNLFELKNAQRVHVSGNVFENNWASAQAGMAILFTVRNQNGTAPWSVVQDVEFENNIIKNTGRGIAVTGEDDLQTSQQTERILIHNNLIENLTFDYALTPVFIATSTPDAPVLNLEATHNTFASATDEDGPTQDIYAISPGTNVDGFILRDNIWVHGTYVLDTSKVDNLTVTNNVIIMIATNANYSFFKSNFATYHPNDFMADPGFASVGFTDYANSDWSLGVSSDFKNDASDGTDPGVDWSALETATAGAILGEW